MRTAALIARNILFYIAFYGGSVGIVVAAVVLLLLGSKRRFRTVVDSWSRWQRLCLAHLIGITVRVEGTIPDGQLLVALKHESFFEAIDLPKLLVFPSVFIKVELARIPLWGLAARRYGLVPVERDQGARALRSMLAAARELEAAGRSIAIFPEGTRVPHATQPPLGSGFAGLYKLLRLPVLAIAVDSGPLYHRWVKRPGVITYRIAAPIPAGLPREEIEARVHAAINALNPEPVR